MKRFLFLALVLLVSTGVASAASIPGAIDAKAGPEIWTISVFNNESSTMDVGDVAEWDIGSSTGDNDNYIIQADSVDTYLVAGVVWPADIAAGSRGTIAIRGPVQVDLLSSLGGAAVGSLLCSSATVGSAAVCSSGATDANAFGFATSAPASASCIAYINPAL